MISITLEPLNHNSKNCIAIKFPYSFKLKEYIKKFNNVYWSKTHRTFYIFFNETRLEDLKEHIKKGGYTILSNTSKDNIKPFVKDLKINLEPLNIEKDKIYRHFLDFLKGKRFSESTISSYGHFVFSFLRFTKEKPINELNENDVRLYISY